MFMTYIALPFGGGKVVVFFFFSFFVSCGKWSVLWTLYPGRLKYVVFVR